MRCVSFVLVACVCVCVRVSVCACFLADSEARLPLSGGDNRVGSL